MPHILNHLPTEELQALDAAHHLHPFTAQVGLTTKGARVIKSGEGVWLTDSEGHRILDAMAGLWCVNIGYGRHELADVAARQMKELPYYNTFFQTTHVPAIALTMPTTITLRPVPRSANIGPGHAPSSPQPSPKSVPPIQ